MEADLQSFVTFYLTGRKQAGRLDDMGPLKLRPAALAGYADLTRLRYDFPLVLIDTPKGWPQSGFQLVAAWLRKGHSGGWSVTRLVKEPQSSGM